MATYKLISSVTVGSGGAANIDFTSIPGTYTDLLLKISARYVQSGSGTLVEVTFNNSGTSYTNRRLLGTGSAASSNSSGTAYINVLSASEGGWTANTFGNGELYIPNYTSANNKSVSADYVTENNATLALSGLTAGLWSNSSAINSIKLTGETGSSLTFAQYSTAYLYGISNA